MKKRKLKLKSQGFLFIPLHIEKYFKKKNIDKFENLIVDLEDGVPYKQYKRALNNLVSILEQRAGKDVFSSFYLRIRNEDALIEGNCIAERIRESNRIRGIVVPKIKKHGWKEYLDSIHNTFRKPIVPIFETKDSFLVLSQILDYLGENEFKLCFLGTEDLARELGIEFQYLQENKLMQIFSEKLIYESRNRDICAVGGANTIISLVDSFHRMKFKEECLLYKSMGYQNRLCFYPGQIDTLSDVFCDEFDIDYIISVSQKFLESKVKNSCILNGKVYQVPNIKFFVSLLDENKCMLTTDEIQILKRLGEKIYGEEKTLEK